MTHAHTTDAQSDSLTVTRVAVGLYKLTGRDRTFTMYRDDDGSWRVSELFTYSYPAITMPFDSFRTRREAVAAMRKHIGL